MEHYSLVAVQENTIVGFGDIDAADYLDRLYVHKDFQCQRIGDAICKELEGMFPEKKIMVHASITARSFLIHRGYRVIREQQVIRHGTALTNYVMERQPDKKTGCLSRFPCRSSEINTKL